jgi:hypothetical protein
MSTTVPNRDALRQRAEEAAAEAATLDALSSLDLDADREALSDAEARLAKTTARLAKAREERGDAARAVAEAESVIRAKVAPLVSNGGISVAWAAQALGLRPTLCVSKSSSAAAKVADDAPVSEAASYEFDTADGERHLGD